MYSPDPKLEHRPEGLELASLAEPALVHEALKELSPRLRASSVVELGISYKIAECKHRRAIGIPVSKAPATHALIVSAMATLKRALPGDSDERLNVICRRYRPGDRLAFHRDSVGLFGEEVFGAVLASQGSGLIFRRGAQEEREEYCLPESAGLVFVSGGPSRYLWSHGVPPCAEATEERVSVTWRWLRSSVLFWFRLGSTERDAWVAHFVKASRQANVSEGHIAAFLCESSSWYVTKNDRMGPLLSADATARALDWQCPGVLPEPEVSSRTPLRLQTALELLQRWEASMVLLDASIMSSRSADSRLNHNKKQGYKVGAETRSFDRGDENVALEQLFDTKDLDDAGPVSDWDLPDLFETSAESSRRNAFAALREHSDYSSGST